MKKWLLGPVVIILAISIVLGSCGGTEDTTTPATTSPSTTPTTSHEVIELSLSYHGPPVASLIKDMLRPWADDLEEACGGRVEIVHHAGGSLFGSAEVYDGLLVGACDIAYVVTGAYPGRFPISDISDLPLIYPDTEVAGTATYEWLHKYAVDTELKDVKFLIALPMAGQQYFGNEEVKVMEDFQGLILRGAGKNDTTLYELLGATGVQIPTEDAFSALDTGMVDGLTFTWSGVFAFGFHNVTKYRTECSIYRPVHQLHMNRQVYEDLPDDIKKIFDDFSTIEASRKYAASHMASEEYSRSVVVKYDERAGNPPIYVLPQEERERWANAAQPMVDDWISNMEKEGLPGQTMYDDLLNIVEKYSQQ